MFSIVGNQPAPISSPIIFLKARLQGEQVTTWQLEYKASGKIKGFYKPTLHVYIVFCNIRKEKEERDFLISLETAPLCLTVNKSSDFSHFSSSLFPTREGTEQKISELDPDLDFK